MCAFSDIIFLNYFLSYNGITKNGKSYPLYIVISSWNFSRLYLIMYKKGRSHL